MQKLQYTGLFVANRWNGEVDESIDMCRDLTMVISYEMKFGERCVFFMDLRIYESNDKSQGADYH